MPKKKQVEAVEEMVEEEAKPAKKLLLSSPVATPLAGKKLTKSVFRLLKKGKEAEKIINQRSLLCSLFTS